MVTADHAHTMSFGGYPARGTDIRGLSGITHDDDLPYTTLSYANGEGYEYHNLWDTDNNKPTRRDLSQVEIRYLLPWNSYVIFSSRREENLMLNF